LAFVVGTLPSCLKKFIILVLQKEGKKNYSLSKSYYLIALKNALAKIVKKILINRISEAIKAHNLLF
jgi:hypothetical protein